MKKYGIFPAAVFLGAFLLFQIQPLIGKYLLPWFGGAPSVWTICLLFFQFLLLGGYAYAHFLQRFKPKLQVVTHCTLLILAVLGEVGLFFLWNNPVLPSVDWRPEQNSWPTLQILRLLFFSIGLPYFLLSSSASLLQAWFHSAEPSKSPYVFYIISNIASLVALVSYPLIAEPFLALKTQALIWSGLFLVYVLFCSLAARRLWPVVLIEKDESKDMVGSRPCWRDYLVWIILSACGVLALMAITNQMTQDIPPVPFLWILPLVLYLLSYIVGFIDRISSSEWWHDIRIILLAYGCYQAWYFIRGQSGIGILNQIVGYGVILFAICLFCHGELYHRKPDPRHLTAFYLSISLGGVFGGVFVAIVAPLIFQSYWEFQLTLGLAAVLAIVSVYANDKSMVYPVRHALWLPVAVMLFFVFSEGIEEDKRSVYRSRNFFGKVYVTKTQFNESVLAYELKHGHITHGAQMDHPVYKNHATTYYTEWGGGGRALLNHPKRISNEPMRVGLLGMGIGTMAVHGRPGDVYRCYEINPAVIDLATNKSWFSYVRDSKAEIEIVSGDGRISLENELKSGSHQFDILVIDVFSGDQVPIHVLTKEAFDIYLDHLAPNGIIAVHISSRYLNLVAPLKAVQEYAGLHGSLIDTPKKGLAGASEWVLLSKNKRILARLGGSSLEGRTARLWTDDYSNLFSVLKK